MGLVLIIVWAPTTAMPVKNYTDFDVDSKAILFNKYTEKNMAKAFISVILHGYITYKQIHPGNNQHVTVAESDAERYKPIFTYDGQAHKFKIVFQTGLNQVTMVNIKASMLQFITR